MRDVAKHGGAPGQVTACIFGLKNAVPEEWRDIQHQHLEHTGKDSGPVKYELSAEARQHLDEVRRLLGPDHNEVSAPAEGSPAGGEATGNGSTNGHASDGKRENGNGR